MDKIEKLVRSLNAKEREAMLLLMQQLQRDPRAIPGIMPLTGMKGWYRIRMGRYRILFTIDSKTKEMEIKRISKRNEKTYKGLQ